MQDVENFSESLREICEKVIITPIIIIYYTYKTWSLCGYLGPLLIYAYIVPFVTDDEKIFLKTVYPSRSATKKYIIKR